MRSYFDIAISSLLGLSKNLQTVRPATASGKHVMHTDVEGNAAMSMCA